MSEAPSAASESLPEPASPSVVQALYGAAVRPLSGPPEPVDPCPACGAETAAPRFAVEGLTSPVCICTECGLARFVPMLDVETVAAFYPADYYGSPGAKFGDGFEWLVRWVGARHASFLSWGMPEGARVLDVGCGRGVVLGALADRGFEVHGMEQSPAAATGADPRAEVRIAPDLASAGYPDAYFDQVLIWHVLEHLTDPRGTLEEIRRVLRPGGRLVVAVPNFESEQARWAGAEWFHLDLPRHLYQFPLKALRGLLEDTGFEPIHDHHFSLRQNPFGWIQSAQNRLASLPRNGLYTLLQRRSPGVPSPFRATTRWQLRLLGALLAPWALWRSMRSAFRRSGATVHVVALRTLDRA
ncbi:MAG: class I SAM-dependent methyltransferase [Myxococcota bacterium]